MNYLKEYLVTALASTKLFEMAYSREKYIDKLNDICKDAKSYNAYRNRCFELYKQHFDPKCVAQKLIDDLISHINEDKN